MLETARVGKIQKVVGAIVLLMICACTQSHDQSPSLTLPQTWTQAPAKLASPQAPFEQPSPLVDESVRTQFAVHTAAASKLQPPAQNPPRQNAPKDWVPWHADGMIVSFAIDAGGLFGALAGDGTTSVKVTWQQPVEKTGEHSAVVSHVKKPAHAGSRRKSLQFKSSMTAADVRRMIDPAIRTAVATRAVKNEMAMRRNLSAKADDFLNLVKVLDGVPSSRPWHVDSLQLQLTVDVQGNVSASVAAGGQVNIYLDWQKSSDKTPGPGAIREGALFQSVAAFAQSMSALIPQEFLDSKDIRKSGLVLDQFQVGVAIIGGLNLAIAQAQGELQGKIIFKNTSATEAEFIANHFVPISETSPKIADIPMAKTVDSNKQYLFADQFGGDGFLQVPADEFRQGLYHAIQMGAYFAKRAREVDTSKWNVTQIETEFDASIGGAFSIVTVSGQGQFVLDFDKPND